MPKRFSLEREKEYYSKVPANTLHSYTPLVPYLCSLVDSPKKVFRSKTFLEIGAGPAHYSWMISEQYVPKLTIALDLVVRQLLTHREEIKKVGVLSVGADCFHLPFHDGAFDIVFGSLVLHRFRNLDGILNEVFRVLSEGGIYFGIEPSLQNPMHVIRHFLANHSRNEYLLSARRLQQAFTSTGFQVEVLRLAPRFPILQRLGLSTCTGIRAFRGTSFSLK